MYKEELAWNYLQKLIYHKNATNLEGLICRKTKTTTVLVKILIGIFEFLVDFYKKKLNNMSSSMDN